MAIRNGFELRSRHPDLSVVAGSFAGNAASNPVASTRTGVGFSVIRVSAGVYRITLGSPPAVPAGLLPSVDRNILLIAGIATVTSTVAGTDRTVTILAQNPVTGVFDFEVKVGAVATDMAATERLNFILLLTDSNILPVRG